MIPIDAMMLGGGDPSGMDMGGMPPMDPAVMGGEGPTDLKTMLEVMGQAPGLPPHVADGLMLLSGAFMGAEGGVPGEEPPMIDDLSMPMEGMEGVMDPGMGFEDPMGGMGPAEMSPF